MKKLLTICAFVLSGQIATAQVTTWKDDPDHTKLTFIITHHGLSSVFGLFERFNVTITSSKQDFSDAVFELSTDVASINTEVTIRDNNLRSKNFFDVTKYPLMTFKSISIVNTTGMKDRFKLTGNLTMHGVTKQVTMDLWFRGTQLDAESKKTKAGFQLTGVINRSDFGVGPSDPFDTGNDVNITADGEFFKQN
jgi:polyisoprenoid-binding protein YceI